MVSYMLDLKKKDALKNVLILVVVEDGLVHIMTKFKIRPYDGLNPCCSGRWSRTT